MNLYYSDLNQMQKDALLNNWKNHNRKDLVKAVEKGEDVEIGDYCDIKDCAVIE